MTMQTKVTRAFEKARVNSEPVEHIMLKHWYVYRWSPTLGVWWATLCPPRK